jgi:YD repeat-containing protein
MSRANRRQPLTRNAKLKANRHRITRFEQLETRWLMAVDWRNPVDALDVDANGAIVPLDALEIINRLNSNEPNSLPAVRDPLLPYYDVTGDQVAAPIDALSVINHLNQEGSGPRKLSEGDGLVRETTVTVTLGQPAGTRTIRVAIETQFDTSDQTTSLEDLLAVYLVDPVQTSTTLLDRGEPGTTLFALAGDRVELMPGITRWDGSVLEIDVPNGSGLDTGVLKFQLLAGDDDRGTTVTVRPLSNEVAEDRQAGPVWKTLASPSLPGDSIDVGSIPLATQFDSEVGNVRYDAVTGRYTAELTVRNLGEGVGRDVIAVLTDMPTGVTLIDASGTTASGEPYVNLRSAIPTGGLGRGARSTSVQLTFDNPDQIAFAWRPRIHAAVNRAPTLAPVDSIAVYPGEAARVQLVGVDPDGDPLTYSVKTPSALPTGRISPSGLLELRPAPGEIGTYVFDVAVSDGELQAIRTVTVDVLPDPVTTTRVSGRILDIAGVPIEGMTVEIGAVQAVTMADGSFLLSLGAGSAVGDTLRVRGDLWSGNEVYPFIAERLELILGHPVFTGFNNVVDRPIYLPELDMANGRAVDPLSDVVVTTDAIPGAAVRVAAGTLMNQQGTLFTGILTITEVPTAFTPAALPDGARPGLVVTIQPGEMTFATPAPLNLPNRAGYPAGTLTDLWSINPTTGDFEVVGQGRVTEDGATIETISGGIRNSSWHFFLNPLPLTPLFLNPLNPDEGCAKCPITASASSQVELHSGKLIETHELVGYSSLGQDRGLQWVYDSLRADARHIVHFDYPALARDANGTLLAAQLSVSAGSFQFELPGAAPNPDKFVEGGEHFWRVPSGTVGIDAALLVDLSDQATGVYDVGVKAGFRAPDGRPLTSIESSSTSIIHVNSRGSEFGAGWGLAGLLDLRYSPRTGDILVVDGSGSQLLYQANFAEESWLAPPGDFSRIERSMEGRFTRTLHSGAVQTFELAQHPRAVGEGEEVAKDQRDLRYLIVSQVDSNGNETRYEYDVDDRLTRIVDPVGLATTFEYVGPRVSTVTDPTDRVTRFEYDERGDLIGIIDPDGSRRSFTYDDEHRMTGETTKRGFEEHVVYNFAGRVERATRGDGSEIQLFAAQMSGLFPAEATKGEAIPEAQDIEGAFAYYVDPLGRLTVHQLDRARQLVRQFDGEGANGVIERNADNQVSQVTDARGNVTRFEYDDRGNVIEVHDEFTVDQALPTITWVATTSGDWSDPANWSEGRVPGPSDRVQIDVPDNQVLVTATGLDIGVAGLVSEESLRLVGGALTIRGRGRDLGHGRLG